MTHKLAISTVSLGWHSSYTLELKLKAAKEAGFQGIELFITDRDSFAASHRVPRLLAAREIKKLCVEADLEILCLAPFDNFEGEPSSLESRLEAAAEWIELAHELGTNIIQVPSNDTKDAVGLETVVVSELQALSDAGLKQQPPISFAYEAPGWGTHVAD